MGCDERVHLYEIQSEARLPPAVGAAVEGIPELGGIFPLHLRF